MGDSASSVIVAYTRPPTNAPSSAPTMLPAPTSPPSVDTTEWVDDGSNDDAGSDWLDFSTDNPLLLVGLGVCIFIILAFICWTASKVGDGFEDRHGYLHHPLVEGLAAPPYTTHPPPPPPTPPPTIPPTIPPFEDGVREAGELPPSQLKVHRDGRRLATARPPATVRGQLGLGHDTGDSCQATHGRCPSGSGSAPGSCARGSCARGSCARGRGGDVRGPFT